MKKGSAVYIAFFIGSMFILGCGAFATLYRQHGIAIACLVAFGILATFYVRYRQAQARIK